MTSVGSEAARARRTQAERRAATRSALVRATVECLVELGYTRTTTQEVQTRAGVSRGALTHHFTAKADMVLAAMDHLHAELAASVRTDAAALPVEPAVPPAEVAPDAVTASASGLASGISPAYAAIQMNRVAHERGVSVADVERLIGRATVGRDLGFIDPNVALDRELP